MSEKSVLEERQKVGMRAVIDGLGPVMDSATLPIQCFFSDEVLEKKPTHLLLFEQHESEYSSYVASFVGRRYDGRVGEAVKFIQIFQPGRHRLIILALAGDEAEERLHQYLHLRSRNYYEASVCFKCASGHPCEVDMVNPDYPHDRCVVASTIVYFEVPEELFAEKPKSVISKFLWNLANLWNETPPRDECHYRRRLLLYAFPKLLVASIVYPIKWLVGGIYALAIFLISLLLLFCGFRPQPIWREMREAFFFQRHLKDPIRRWRYHSYRVWFWDDKTRVLMPITGIEVLGGLLLLGLMGVAVIFCLSRSSWFSLPLVVLVALVFLVSLHLLSRIPAVKMKMKQFSEGWIGPLVGRYSDFWQEFHQKRFETLVRKRKEKELRQAREQTREQKEFQEWLHTTFSLENAPLVVDLKKLPRPQSKTKQITQTVSVKFWAIKRAVCRPYPK